MEQAAEQTQTNGHQVIVNFRAQPEDAAALKEAAQQQRTSVSSLVRGALVSVGLLGNTQKQEVPNA